MSQCLAIQTINQNYVNLNLFYAVNIYRIQNYHDLHNYYLKRKLNNHHLLTWFHQRRNMDTIKILINHCFSFQSRKRGFSLLPISYMFFQTYKIGILKVLLWVEGGPISQDGYTPLAHHKRSSHQHLRIISAYHMRLLMWAIKLIRNLSYIHYILL